MLVYPSFVRLGLVRLLKKGLFQKVFLLLAGLLAFLMASNAQAQYCRPGTLMQWSCGNSFSGGPDLSSPLVTDRPDFTEASSTVGLGVAQLEFGYTYAYNDDAGVVTKANSYGEPLLRFGVLADWLEMRVGWNYATEEVGGVKNSGSEDLYLGFKIGLTPQEGLLPEMALIPQMTVPSGANAFTSDEVLAGVNWIYSWERPCRLTPHSQWHAKSNEPVKQFTPECDFGFLSGKFSVLELITEGTLHAVHGCLS